MIKQFALSVWQMCDPLYFACTRLQYVERHPQNIFRVRLLYYRGKSLQLRDGTIIQSGDLLLKIHLHNVRLLRQLLSYEGEIARSRQLYRLVERSLPGLACYCADHPRSHEIKAIIGITQINRGCAQLGFDVCNIHNVMYRTIKRLMLFPIHLLSVAQPFRSFCKHEPKLLLMSRDTLEWRYGQNAHR
jgi:hypothetical protein